VTSLRLTQEGKVRLRTSTGQDIERWPVDARGILACGGAVAIEAAPSVAVVAPVLPPPLAANPLQIPNVASHARDVGPGTPAVVTRRKG